MNYTKFIESKRKYEFETGISVDKLNSSLFDFQNAITKWALKRARACIFADTGLGKTAMQGEWAHQVSRHTSGKILIVAPLIVMDQSIREIKKILGYQVKYISDQSEVDESNIFITNYERLTRFDSSEFNGIVIDESSILKNFAGKRKREIIDFSKDIPYRLACTATPAPNDITEIANHVEFLGIMKRTDMLSKFFCQ